MNNVTYYLCKSKVSKIDQHFNIHLLLMEDVTLYEYDPNVLAKDSKVVNELDYISIAASDTAKKTNNIEIGTDSRFYLIRQDDENKRYYLMNYVDTESTLNSIQSECRSMKQLLKDGYDFRRTLKGVSKMLYAFKDKLSDYNILPLNRTREQYFKYINGIEEYLIEFAHENSSLMWGSSTPVTSNELREAMNTSDRKELIEYYLNCRDNATRAHAQIQFNPKEIHVTDAYSFLNKKVMIEDVEIRKYQRGKKFEECELICKVDHLNLFLSEVQNERVNNTDGDVFVSLVNVFPYRRSNNTSVDVSVRLLKYAPIENWIENLDNKLDEWNNHLQEKGIADSASIHKKIREMRRSVIANFDSLFLHPDCDIEGMKKRIQELDLKYSKIKEYQVTLHDEQNMVSYQKHLEYVNSLEKKC